MILLLVFAVVCYSAIAIAFFTLCIMELCETGAGGVVTFTAVLASALLWPVAVLAMAIAVSFVRQTGVSTEPAA